MRLLALCFFLVLAGLTAPPHSRAGSSGPVVELFTSQGCSSCPPADALLGEIAQGGDVIALSFHVDYWNYIGWRDPFSSPESTRRQRDYRRSLGQSYVYTPQIIVDGSRQTVGSNRSSVTSLIRRARQRPRLPVVLSRAGKGVLRIRVPARSHKGPPADVWAIFYDRAHTTKVRAGENDGRTLQNANVVRRIHRAGTWDGRDVELRLSPSAVGAEGRDGCAILVQEAGPGQILGAAAIRLSRR